MLDVFSGNDAMSLDEFMTERLVNLDEGNVYEVLMDVYRGVKGILVGDSEDYYGVDVDNPQDLCGAIISHITEEVEFGQSRY